LSRPKPRTTPPSIPRPSEEKCLLRSLSNAVAPCSRVPARTGRPTFLSLQTFRNDSAVHEDTPPTRYAAASTAIKSGDQTYMESEVPAPAPPRPCRWPVPPMRGPRPQRPAALPLAGGACVIDPAVLRGERVQVIPSALPAPAPPRPCQWPAPPMRGPCPHRPAALPLAGGACVIDPAVLRGERVQVIPIGGAADGAAAALPMASAADARPKPAEARGAAVGWRRLRNRPSCQSSMNECPPDGARPTLQSLQTFQHEPAMARRARRLDGRTDWRPRTYRGTV
jgi:hypothetical protein